jgi:hypothetical protein
MMRSRSIITFVAALILGFTSKIAAHPLGNFSISQYSAIQVGAQEVELRYIVDMAEIPTFQEIQEAGLVPKADDESATAYAKRKAESLSGGLLLEINGRRVPLQLESHEIIFPEGAGGLPTLKIGSVYKGKLTAVSGGDYSLSYRDSNFPGRAGWKEIIAVAAPGVKLLSSSVPETDRSARISDYPTDLLNSPPQQLAAQMKFAVVLPPGRVDNFSAERTLERVQAAKPVVKPAIAETAQVRPTVVPALAQDWAIRRTGVETQQPSNAAQFVHGDHGEKRFRLGVIPGGASDCRWAWRFSCLSLATARLCGCLSGRLARNAHAFLLGVIVTASHTSEFFA